MRDTSFVVLDIETTGLRPGRHGMTEIYAERIKGTGESVASFHTLINPGQRIPSFITRLTGIDDQMVEGAPSEREAIRSFADFVNDDDVLVGHNVRFDLSFLNYAKELVFNEPFWNRTLCTLLLSRRVFANSPLHSYKLGNIAQVLGLDTTGAHRAAKDVEMTIALQQHLFCKLEECKVDKVQKALDLQRWPLEKAARKLVSVFSSSE